VADEPGVDSGGTAGKAGQGEEEKGDGGQDRQDHADNRKDYGGTTGDQQGPAQSRMAFLRDGVA
jgi:hypothetical protein